MKLSIKMIKKLAESTIFSNFIIIAILINAILNLREDEDQASLLPK
jgi:hypothetical protein